MIVDLAFELAVSDQVDRKQVAAQYVTFKRLFGMLQDRGTDDGVLTAVELEVLQAADAVMAVLLHLSGNEASSSLPSVDAALRNLTGIATSLRDQPSHRPTMLDILPQWETYHESYLSLELALVLAALSAKLAVAKLPSSTASQSAHAAVLRPLAPSLFAAVQESFGMYKRVVDELASGGDETDALVSLVVGGGEGTKEDGVGRAVCEVVGERNVRRLLLGYVQGARVAVDAVLSVKFAK